MLHSGAKKKAVKEMNSVIDEYNALSSEVQNKLLKLYERRKEGTKTIQNLEKYINTLARTPKELKKSIQEINVQIEEFVKITKHEEYKPEVNAGGTAAAGGAVGGVVSALGPKAVIAIATTFGRAGTGTAIKSLSGAAAKKAALAWIGRTAGAAGAPAVAGQAVLNALGPIGWGITAISLVSAGYKLDKGNRKLIEECLSNKAQVEEDKAYVEKALAWVGKTDKATSRLIISIKNGLFACNDFPEDYKLWGEEEKMVLMKAINKARALGELIMLKMEGDEIEEEA